MIFKDLYTLYMSNFNLPILHLTHLASNSCWRFISSFYHRLPYDFSLNPRRMKAKKERKMKARRMKMKMGKKKRKVKKLGRMRLLQARIETRNIDSSGNLSRCCCNF